MWSTWVFLNGQQEERERLECWPHITSNTLWASLEELDMGSALPAPCLAYRLLFACVFHAGILSASRHAADLLRMHGIPHLYVVRPLSVLLPVEAPWIFVHGGIKHGPAIEAGRRIGGLQAARRHRNNTGSR
ncbi:unnamed protein product [Urochloa humidicola]